MQKYLLRSIVFISLLIPALVCGQVIFIIDSVPDYTPDVDQIYIAGSFNGWNPGDADFILEKNEEEKWAISLSAEEVGPEIQYKFTRGDWGKVEKGINGEEINDRVFTFGTDTVVHHTIYNWADANGSGSTAAENVSVIDEAFEMPQLNRTRRIWIYYPPDYEDSGKSYPVIYMHDGQNLFDANTSFLGEWEIDETLNELYEEGYQVPIVIGIDNGGEHRGNELTPWYNSGYDIGGEGDQYLAFIVETLKPFVDANYRTLSDRDNTAMIGSSLGGLISNYGAIKYQDVFSKVGPFSPAYWINYDSIMNYVETQGFQKNILFYQNVGENEGDQYISQMYAMEQNLKDVGFNQISSKVIAGGDHNEATWRDDFRTAYLWLFTSFASDIDKPMKQNKNIIVPNPVNDELVFAIELTEETKLKIFDLNGRCLIDQMINSNRIDVSELVSGTYLITLNSDKGIVTSKFVKL